VHKIADHTDLAMGNLSAAVGRASFRSN